MPNYGTKKTGDHWRAGGYYAICDRCGFKKRASELIKTWDGLMVCAEDYEPRHPQDFVRGIKEKQSVPDARPDVTPTYLSDNEVTIDDL